MVDVEAVDGDGLELDVGLVVEAVVSDDPPHPTQTGITTKADVMSSRRANTIRPF